MLTTIKRTELQNNKLTKALDEWIRILKAEQIIPASQATLEYGQNELVEPRNLPVALIPYTTSEVIEIVKIANKYQVPLYPISTGHNWGYGGASPVQDKCAVLDLSKLNKILDFDKDLGLVTVQPGVTAEDLYIYLQKGGYNFLVPVTGAGPDCSLMGNALERGYGVTPHADHFGAVTNLKAILPDGSLYESALSTIGGGVVDRAFKWGLGPYLDGLFTQGNLGVVIEMTIALAPIPDHIEGFLISLNNDEDLEKAVKAIREVLNSVGNVIGSINLMNAHRTLAMVENYPYDKVGPDGILPQEVVSELTSQNHLSPWTIGGIIYGNRKIAKHVRKTIRNRFKGIAGRCLFVTRNKINLFKKICDLLPERYFSNIRKQLNNLSESFKVAEGKPSQIALPLCYWKSRDDKPEGKPMNPSKAGIPRL